MKLSRQTFFNRIALRRFMLTFIILVSVFALAGTPTVSRVDAAPLPRPMVIESNFTVIAPAGAYSAILRIGFNTINPSEANVHGTLCTTSGGCASVNVPNPPTSGDSDSAWTVPVSVVAGDLIQVIAGKDPSSANHLIVVPGSGCNVAKTVCNYSWEDWDDYDNDDLSAILVVSVDPTPPTTTHSLAGTLGNNGYYTSNVLVTLTATDNAGGTGVASTTLDGSAYTAPRTITTEGTTAHTYFSVDSFGNTETTKNFTSKSIRPYRLQPSPPIRQVQFCIAPSYLAAPPPMPHPESLACSSQLIAAPHGTPPH